MNLTKLSKQQPSINPSRPDNGRRENINLNFYFLNSM